jgi:hypothetical protein
MFFLQQQLRERRCGHWTEVPAYLFKEPLAPGLMVLEPFGNNQQPIDQ